MRRNRFRFSLRTLLLCVTGLCIAWGLTQTWGVPCCESLALKDVPLDASFELSHRVDSGIALAPFVVRVVRVSRHRPYSYSEPHPDYDARRELHYLWLFGYTRRLPFLDPPRRIDDSRASVPDLTPGSKP